MVKTMIYDKMEDCFASLKEKIAYALDHTDTDSFFRTLDEIQGPTLVCGVGGSSIAAFFLSKVLSEKRKMIARFAYPRDLYYMDLSPYENVIAVSYSGNNIGANAIFDTDLKKYLFTGHPRKDCANLLYTMKEERSYVSISATLVPVTLAFLYYRNDRKLVEKILDQEITSDSGNASYEILSGYESATAAMLLESSFSESGMAMSVIHDKYNYCHGRINLSRISRSDLIFLKNGSELDEMLYEQLKSHYPKIITLQNRYEDPVISDYDLTLRSMKLIHQIARNKKTDISDMKELPDNDILYLYQGKMR